MLERITKTNFINKLTIDKNFNNFINIFNLLFKKYKNKIIYYNISKPLFLSRNI